MFTGIIKYLSAIFHQLKDPLIVFFTTIGLFLAPIAELVVAAIVLALFDFITAIIAAYKNKITITSEKMGPTFSKLLLYSSVIICAHILDVFVASTIRIHFLDHILGIFFSKDSLGALDHLKLTAAVTFLIVVREMKSIDENWEKVFGWSFINTCFSHLIKPIIKIKTFLAKHGTKENK